MRTFTERHGYLTAAAFVAFATAAFTAGRENLASGQWALLYVLIVGLTAGVAGARPALLAAVLSFLCWNFFLIPPFYTLFVHDPHDLLSLVVFLVVAAAIGMQTGRLREREAEAEARRREASMLNQFSSSLVCDVALEEMIALLLREVVEISHAAGAALFLTGPDGNVTLASSVPEGQAPEPEVAAAAQWSAQHGRAGVLPQQPDCEGRPPGLFIPLQSEKRLEGVLYVGPQRGSQACTTHPRPIMAVANLAAAYLERKRLQTRAVQADALREADRLKSTLVSSVSHELKTPIASIAATVGNLTEDDVEWDRERVAPELASIQADLDRLSGSITALLDLSRLESASWKPEKEWFDLSDVVWMAVKKVPSKQRQRVDVSMSDSLPMVHVDSEHMARAIENLLTNALLYSPPASPVRLGADVCQGRVTITVDDEGPGVQPDEAERIFDKFFRGRASASAPSGTGLGLAVAREIVRFYGGRIRVENLPGRGARFSIELPAEKVPAP